MIRQRFERFLARRCTLLGVGPISKNCVDAAIDLANEYEVPLMLIASRHQIDSKEFGGGYVNGWTTEFFAHYVQDRDKKGRIFLVRDHGGPWQNPAEKRLKLSLRRAMESAKNSFFSDIHAGFQILHIDPSIDIHGRPNVDELLDRIFELYEFCWEYSQQKKQEIMFEIGTEEQTGSTNTQEELNHILNSVKKFCKKYKFPMPLFVVIQTGTRVMETRNVGSFDSPVRIADEIPPEIQIPKMIEICSNFEVLMKAHNVDYLSDESLQWYPRLGIHAANVAPEFGVTETKALLAMLEQNGLSQLAERFLNLAYDSGEWAKWMLENSEATERERAIIAGHYVFSTEECKEIKNEAKKLLSGQGIELDEYLRAEIKRNIFRYMHNFRLVR